MALPAVGGDTTSIDAGGTALTTVATAIGGESSGISLASQQGGGAGDAAIQAALNRYAAAMSGLVEALKTQVSAAGELAHNAAADLNTAGGH